MRPVYHQIDDRIEGHLWITLLAYHVVHHIRLHLKENEIHDSWETLRGRMHNQMQLTTVSSLTGWWLPYPLERKTGSIR